MNYWDTKSQKKWQKSFITNVFAQKTKQYDTYSKIIMNNPELLNGKNDHIPTSAGSSARSASQPADSAGSSAHTRQLDALLDADPRRVM